MKEGTDIKNPMIRKGSAKLVVTSENAATKLSITPYGKYSDDVKGIKYTIMRTTK